jgi:ankyrin repeat protein
MTDMNFTMNRLESDPLRILYLWSDRSDSIAHMFLDHGIDYSYIYLDKNTLLHLAAEYGKVNLVERLLSLGHAVDQENDHGCTPLHSASSIDVKRVLLAAGANVNERSDHGLTPLHTATERGVIEEMEVL